MLVVLRKECLDNFRDTRTILSSFSLAVLGPIFFVGLMVFVIEQALGEADEPITFAVVGAEHAPQLISHLSQYNVDVTPIATDSPRKLVTEGDHDLVLVISPNYADRYARGNVNTLQLIHDSSKINATRRHLMLLSAHISQYSQTVGALRMQLRGVDPTLINPIVAREVDVSSPAARALTILASLPYFLVLVIFMGGFYLAIDTTAGEREHGSLEPLLTQPITRTQLVLGKIGATSIFGGISLAIFCVSLAFAIPFVPFRRLGMALTLGAEQLLPIFVICTPLLLFAASLLTVVASYAKSYKEAQTYLTLVVLVPTLPLIFAQLTNVQTNWGVMFVPSLSQANLMTDIIKGEAITALNVGTSMLTTLVYGSLLAWLSVRLYSRERILG
jgi:sodium transport system permease protein